ncbi:hypothetical protein FA15DRAFT_709849 [Coprinopsis marcescibilis]|uniref:Uncharacterized protein n=1 Tax=Coprinopsis marcescibilis TaxID=230819 RepID=A0A5C3KEX9_COPMA|nr:hypothetical protein FA15DRAFT_709849 [Coprinopsis marcescibilis]
MAASSYQFSFSPRLVNHATGEDFCLRPLRIIGHQTGGSGQTNLVPEPGIGSHTITTPLGDHIKWVGTGGLAIERESSQYRFAIHFAAYEPSYVLSGRWYSGSCLASHFSAQFPTDDIQHFGLTQLDDDGANTSGGNNNTDNEDISATATDGLDLSTSFLTSTQSAAAHTGLTARSSHPAAANASFVAPSFLPSALWDLTKFLNMLMFKHPEALPHSSSRSEEDWLPSVLLLCLTRLIGLLRFLLAQPTQLELALNEMSSMLPFVSLWTSRQYGWLLTMATPGRPRQTMQEMLLPPGLLA